MSAALLLPSQQPLLYQHDRHLQPPAANAVHAVFQPPCFAPAHISSSYKSIAELPTLCASVIHALLCGPTSSWSMDRYANFALYCNRLLTQLDISAPVAYTSLRYVQRILANSININIIDLTDTAHECSLFTVSLLLAYKFLEDSPPYMRQWSSVSALTLKQLTLLETRLLEKLDYRLNIPEEQLNDWVGQCHQLQASASSATAATDLNQFNEIYDLHGTRPTLGCSMFLPVYLSEAPIGVDQTTYPNIDLLPPQPVPDFNCYSDNNGFYLYQDSTTRIAPCSNNNACVPLPFLDLQQQQQQQNYFQYPAALPFNSMIHNDALFDEPYYYQQQPHVDLEDEEVREDEVITPPSAVIAPSAVEQQLLWLLMLQQQATLLEQPYPNVYPHFVHNDLHCNQQQQEQPPFNVL